MAQITKEYSWENVVTKVDIISFVVPNFRTSTPANHLIYNLQSSRFDESVFLLVLGLAPFGLYHCLYPSGHALNQVSTNLLWYTLPFHLHSPPQLKYTSRRDFICIELLLEVLPEMFNRVEVR
jgi:hypothetical protein